MRTVRIRAVVGMTIALAVLSTACADEEPVATTAPATTLITQTTHGPVVSVPFVALDVGLSPDGTYLVDAEGRSLYLFTLDDSRTSSCDGACAEAWPPLLGDPQATDGVDPGLLGNAERGNGTIQVTYNGWPLYRYAGDSEPGDTAGQGFNDVWFLVAPDGTPVGS